MNNLPFDKPGKLLRGNLHCHSTGSDGLATPEQICKFYRKNGYDFLAITDHFMGRFNFPMTDTRPYQTDTFTTLIGAELHADKTELGDFWHILAVGLPLDFAKTAKDETGPQLAKRALDTGAYVAAAHPQWYTLSEQDILSLGDIHAIEVFNSTAIDHNDRADSWYMLDLLLAHGHRYTACATDDAHYVDVFQDGSRSYRHDAMRGWVYVKAEANEPELLLDALKRGAYYSSNGPQIHDVQITDSEVIVKCSPAERVFLTGRSYSAASISGSGITEARIPRQNFTSPYARVTVRDSQHNRAWTNPFWFES